MFSFFPFVLFFCFLKNFRIYAKSQSKENNFLLKFVVQTQTKKNKRCLTEFSQAPYNNLSNLKNQQSDFNNDNSNNNDSNNKDEINDENVKKIEKTNETTKSKEKKKESNNDSWYSAVLKESYKEFRRLTWCNVGIQYDWTLRKYNLNIITQQIPDSMILLCNYICNLINLNMIPQVKSHFTFFTFFIFFLFQINE